VEVDVDVGRYINESPRIFKLWTTKDVFELAWERFKTFKDRPMSFSDCVSLAGCCLGNAIGQASDLAESINIRLGQLSLCENNLKN